MKEFQNFLLESLNSPYEWDFVIQQSDEWFAMFHDSNKMWFGVSFLLFVDMYAKSKIVKNWMVAFGNDPDSDGSYDKFDMQISNTGLGDSQRVLSTVMDIVMTFVKLVKPQNFSFTGHNQDGHAKLYTIMLKKYKLDFNRLGYKIEDPAPYFSGATKFLITRER